MTSTFVAWAFFALFLKHFIFDFLLQGPYQYLNKGTYGHPGGILHSGLQAVGSFAALYFLTPLYGMLFVLCVVEFIIHYNVDWAKMNINKHYGLKPDNSEYFWWLLGLDQLLHYLTYFGMILFLI
jgi:hypothetical protein